MQRFGLIAPQLARAPRDFSHAIAAAKLAGLADEVERLSQRAEDVRRVYNSQFRGVGR